MNVNFNPRIKCRPKAQYTDGRHSLAVLVYVIALALVLAFLSGLCSGCSLLKTKPDRKKIKDLEYTIVEEHEIPEKLMDTIQEKKEAEFKIAFESDGFLYLVHGYGEQETGGYSIAIRDLYLTERALYFDTELLGPENGSNPQKKPSFPYIVVKTAKQEQNVVFE